jgi:hypothetical protein
MGARKIAKGRSDGVTDLLIRNSGETLFQVIKFPEETNTVWFHPHPQPGSERTGEETGEIGKGMKERGGRGKLSLTEGLGKNPTNTKLNQILREVQQVPQSQFH